MSLKRANNIRTYIWGITLDDVGDTGEASTPLRYGMVCPEGFSVIALVLTKNPYSNLCRVPIFLLEYERLYWKCELPLS